MGRHVVVVGAGPAGLGAASGALRAGARVTLLDAAERPGGQIHRTAPVELGGPRLELAWPGLAWWAESSVWAFERSGDGAPLVHVLRGGERFALEPDALVLAPGAHDRVLPFPGWDLPGVYTAGAAQALAKGECLAVGEKVVVAGSGPFLLPVAASLLEAGSRVVEVLEANPASTVLRGWGRPPWQVSKVGELAGYAALLARHRVPVRMGRTVVEARGDGRVEEVVTARLRADWSVVPGSERSHAVDAVCVSHGFSPRLELAVAAGCAVDGFVRVDGDQRTSAAGVFAAGEVTGIAGAPAAKAEGLLAGWIAGGGSPRVPALRRRRDQGRAFARRLAAAHPIGDAWKEWLRPGTVVCRCEEATYGDLCRAAGDQAANAPRAVRLATRAGLGPCQGRVCGPTVAEILGSPPAHHRPIAQPIRLGELAAPVREATPDER
ncbi:NAD(P)/FAD-dependent oxidoreductase [Spirillospora sp. CA-294931]|uniref:FAD/NAD(P)-dependent oxidoreductase n=1 Tax=Spirillospora sp. CA-294931 TaxID=3240042 RepID=UPI003D921147